MAEIKRSYTPDTLNVYGSWSDTAAFWIEPSVRHVLRPRLAGYIKAEGAGQPGPPLLGFTRRYVKPGHMDGLAASFQKVCDLWYKRVPGILAASVHREPEQPNVVHDIRIFANHEAFQAHTDKSDPELIAALEAWFEHYDTGEPFTGQLYYPATSASDGGLRTSSIKGRPVRVGFDEFEFGQEGMLGPMPDMAKS
jgi:quinol monooxygenase YgiN